MKRNELIHLPRTNFARRIPSSSSSSSYSSSSYHRSRFSIDGASPPRASVTAASIFSAFFRSVFTKLFYSPDTSLTAVSPSLGRKVTGTLFGRRRGHVTFAVQSNLVSDPIAVIQLAVSTAALVREMASGIVRIALECENKGLGFASGSGSSLAAAGGREGIWTMYCNGKRCGHAMSRECAESDWYMLESVRRVSVGAGVIPEEYGSGDGKDKGEMLYMRSRFERVVGSRDSEAFYMINPDGNGGPELSIFLLRV